LFPHTYIHTYTYHTLTHIRTRIYAHNARAGGRDGLTVLEYFFITERK